MNRYHDGDIIQPCDKVFVYGDINTEDENNEASVLCQSILSKM
jgi:hypothetical protein